MPERKKKLVKWNKVVLWSILGGRVHLDLNIILNFFKNSMWYLGQDVCGLPSQIWYCVYGCLLEEKIVLFRASKIFQVAKSQISIRPFQCLLFQNEDVK